MEPWMGSAVPVLPGGGTGGERLALYDTARQGVYPVAPPPDGARMYVCGITPYDATHLGHAATMITFDLVGRVWRDAGVPVRYVQNVTDIDDPLLERASRDREDWIVLGLRETALFREDMEALRVIPPDHFPGAVESIPLITARVAQLLDAGTAYRLADGTGDVYFDIGADPRFGYQSRLPPAEMRALFAERGGDPDRPGKRDPLDPLLWRGAREGEPAWPGDPGGEFGPGRPGWHIECAAIALDRLGETIDVQGGGNDLIYPHHECSAAHAESLTGVAPFAGHYVHAGMIGLAGEKMSKSRGNLVFVSRLRADGVDPMALRLALLAGHYRADRQWTDEARKQGEQRLARWRAAAGSSAGTPADSAAGAASGASAGTASGAPAGPPAAPVLAAVRERLRDDLDTAAALAAVDAWAEAALSGTAATDPAAPALVRTTVDALLGVAL